MRIIITASQAMDLGVWDALCKRRGLNVWAVNEGLMDGSHEIALELDEAEALGLIPKRHTDTSADRCEVEGTR